MNLRRLTIVLALALSLTGCAFLTNQKANFDACMADTECKAQAQGWADRVETASTIVASGVPLPGAAAAPKVLKYLTLGIAALMLGRGVRKKEETPV